VTELSTEAGAGTGRLRPPTRHAPVSRLLVLYLGTHEVSWLGRYDFPMMISLKRLQRQKTYPRALGRWILDSGAFSELQLHGRHVLPEAEYAEWIRRAQAEIGGLDWAAPQDWMCEPVMLARTGLTIERHQGYTVGNYCRLKEMGVRVIPVLQGWTIDDYFRCIALYRRSGVDLDQLPLVGVGSICRRQGTLEIAELLAELKAAGLRLHAFGLKKQGIAAHRSLVSCDSLAWSYNARKHPPLEGCTHARCQNCARWAMKWREELLGDLRYRALADYQATMRGLRDDA
jgi:hypothetical protein